jgi:hypothetical protein
VHQTGLKRRALRLNIAAGLGVALLAFAALPAVARAQDAATLATETTLKLDARGLAGATQTTATASVTGVDGQPASGVIAFEDGNRLLAEAVLNSAGQATANLTLPAGAHSLSAVYSGDATHQASASAGTEVHTEAASTSTGTTPNYQLSLSPISPTTLPMTLTAGDTGSVTVTVTPVNNASLAAPMFVTLSCSGLPTGASCSFTPASVEIQSTTPASCPSGSPAAACPPTSLMAIATAAQTGGGPTAPADRTATPVGLSLLLPGVLGLGGMVWGARRRRWLQRIALVALVGLVSTLGMTACNPYYDYYNHGPTQVPATPSGTYTVTITAQSNNGVSALTNSTTMVLTVQ